jgi:hypothetical protein
MSTRALAKPDRVQDAAAMTRRRSSAGQLSVRPPSRLPPGITYVVLAPGTKVPAIMSVRPLID